MPVTTTIATGRDQLGLCQALEDFANEQWVAWVWDQCERTLAGELKLLGLEIGAGTSFS